MGAKRMIFVRARNKNNSDWPFILEFFHANLFHTNIVDVIFALANQLEDRYILKSLSSGMGWNLATGGFRVREGFSAKGFSAIIGAYKVQAIVLMDFSLSTTTFVFDKRGWNLSYYLIKISFIKYHMKNSESILYMYLVQVYTLSTALYETQDISDIVIFNNMAMLKESRVSLGIVIAFCVAIGLYSRYRSDCLLQEEFRVTNRNSSRDSSFQDLLIVYINSSPVRRIKAVIKQALVVGVLTLLSELKVLWQAFKYEVSVLLRSFFPYFIDYSEINTSHNLLWNRGIRKGQITIQNKLAVFSLALCFLVLIVGLIARVRIFEAWLKIDRAVFVAVFSIPLF
ncbi:hypothetical protein ACJX0J_004836, partial (mitochondrion) [Zea mays]